MHAALRYSNKCRKWWLFTRVQFLWPERGCVRFKNRFRIKNWNCTYVRRRSPIYYISSLRNNARVRHVTMCGITIANRSIARDIGQTRNRSRIYVLSHAQVGTEPEARDRKTGDRRKRRLAGTFSLSYRAKKWRGPAAAVKKNRNQTKKKKKHVRSAARPSGDIV